MADKGIWAIILCRFVFGTRAPTYVASGFLRYSFPKFVAVDSSVAQLSIKTLRRNPRGTVARQGLLVASPVGSASTINPSVMGTAMSSSRPV